MSECGIVAPGAGHTGLVLQLCSANQFCYSCPRAVTAALITLDTVCAAQHQHRFKRHMSRHCFFVFHFS